jgi:pyruvate ferredoxin oxidoreductase alpha subunit
MKQINPDVCAAYPITPATEIMQIFASYVADGSVATELVTVESEHSAMSATIGACCAGARSMTATSSQGLALMWEMLYIAAGLRLPIVMPMVNRALSAPINIHCDHSDSMGARDSGWIQINSESGQEAYDNLLQAMRIAEHPDIQLPAMVTFDGFITSHSMEPLDALTDDEVQEFIGAYKPRFSLLDVEHPITVGAIDFHDYYFEHRRALAEPMLNGVLQVALEVGEEFGKKFGRKYGLFEEYKMDGAEVAIVVLGSAAGTAKVVIDELREKGMKVGMIKVRMFRPFPYLQIAEALSGVTAVAVLDRSDALAGMGGPVYGEIRSALYDSVTRPTVVNYIYGLGGRDITLEHISSVYHDLLAIANGETAPKLVNYLGVRE